MSLFSSRRSFTLIELLVVVAILATLSGLVISRLDWVQGSSTAAASATGSAQIQNNLQVYKTQFRAWPEGYDSLIDQNGGTPQVYTKVFGEEGPGSPGTLSWVEPTTFTAPAAPGDTNSPVYSLTQLGVRRVYDHDSSVTDFNASATIERAGISFTDDHVFATVRTTRFGQPTPIVTALYPQGLPADVVLIALGIGPNCGAVGTTMASAPISPATDGLTFYSRYAAIFACYTDGRAAQLKAVVDSTGTVVQDQLRNYTRSAPE